MRAPLKRKPPVARTTEGEPSAVEANGNTSFAHWGAAGKATEAASRFSGLDEPATVFRDLEGRLWRYTGKRGRVLAMLVSKSDGVTQWDTLPWHTRLGGTIHVFRGDGLAIVTELEGEYRHARYRLATAGHLIKKRTENGRQAA